MKGSRTLKLGVVFILLALAAATSTIPSFAVGPVITGVVRDLYGGAIAGATASDGWRSVTADSGGRYTIVETTQGTYTITASKTHFLSASQNVDTLNNTNDVDFSLAYLIYPSLSPVYFNFLPQTLSLTATSLAPPASVVVTSGPSGEVTLSSDGVAGGLNKWTGSYPLTSQMSDGTYQLSFSGSDPSSGAVITNVGYAGYVLDRVNPTLSSPQASPFGSDPLATRSSKPTLSVAASDERSGIDAASVHAEVRDALGTSIVSGTGTYSGGRASYAVPITLQDGSYSATFSIRDRAGNSGSKDFNFIVDTQLPKVLWPSPNDDVRTGTPTITSEVTHSGPSAPNSPTMTLDGIGVGASYNSSTGVVSFTPPTPLPPGEHRIVVGASDSAGNSASMSFSFWVLSRLTYDSLSRTYLPTSCPNAGVSLISLLNGRGVTAFQISHARKQTAATDLVSRYLFSDAIEFAWTPTLSGQYTHEIIRSGVPLLNSRAGSLGAGGECGLPPDTNSIETLSTSMPSYSRGQFGPGGSQGSGFGLPGGTYAWRVKDSASNQSTATDRFLIMPIVGKWATNTVQDVYVDDAFSPEWESAANDAASIWNDISGFSYRLAGRCNSVTPCDSVNHITSRDWGSNGPLGMTEYALEVAGEGNIPDTLGCCFRITLNSSQPFSGSSLPSLNEYDLISAMAHELGHGAGVGHDFTFPGSIMYDQLGKHWVRRIPLDLDRNTMRHIYPDTLLPYVKPLEMIRRSDLIIRGLVVNPVSSSWNSDHTVFYTDYAILVSEVLKGDPSITSVIVRNPGGVDPETGYQIAWGSAPDWADMQEVILFLTTENLSVLDMTEGTHFYVSFWSSGAYDITGDQATNQLRSDLSETTANLEARIRAIVQGLPDPYPLGGLPIFESYAT